MMKRELKKPVSYEKHPEAHPSSTGRIAALLVFVLVVGVVALTRLYVIQIADHEKWRGAADSQHSLSADVFPDRGEIFFREGNTVYPAAVNREYPLLYVVPREIEEPRRIAEALSGITGVSVDEILAKFSDREDPFEVIKKRLPEDEADRIRGLDMPGVRFLNEKYRYYPGGSLAAQVVGFVSAKDGGGESGRYGVEAFQDGLLRGKPGNVVQARDAAGRWISTSDRKTVSSEEGPDIILSIDHVIQHEVETILRDAVEKHGADGGTVIVMDPATGKILAMASNPGFNPNEYSKTEDYSRFLNPAVSQTYEPGSIMKPITMAIGIEEGKVAPGTEFTDSCAISEAGYVIRNAEDKCYGRSTMTKVLEESINTGVIFVEKLVGNARFAEYFDRFGFGRKTGIELPAELSGDTKNLDDIRRDIQFFTASFGQGVTMTPLQMISSYQVLANGGLLMRPSIMEKYIHADGREELSEPSEVRQVVSKETATLLGDMLENVVKNGHGKRAAVPGYRVGGKTGTAQVAKKGEKGYDDGLTIGSFVGYAPIGDPRFVVLSKIDNPKDVIWAESSAAPVFGDVMKFLLSYAKIEPTEEIQNAK
ncbi:MAG: penicillin-binding protein 2 [Candidatus Moranbacteria bacterium]|nr:penicillin-binding protein 2 [Candidatus Moranbacteria bacterium]